MRTEDRDELGDHESDESSSQSVAPRRDFATLSESPEAHEAGTSRVRIEPNGSEFLVIINGSAFLALSRSQAEAIARRTRGGSVEKPTVDSSDHRATLRPADPKG